MSNGIIEINGNLHIEAQNALLARGDAIISLNKSGESTVGIDGNINFNYDGPTSGTGVNATIDITLNGADSYWNGNTLISWNGTPSDESKLTVSEMTLIVKDGATWTPTAIQNTADQKYTSLNNLILDNGNVAVNNGVEIAIDNVSGVGYLSNEGTVTLTSGALEGRIDNAGVINLDPGASASEVTFEQGTDTANKGLIVVDAEHTTLNGGMATGTDASASVVDVTMSVEKDVTMNGVDFKGNTFTAGSNNPIIGAIAATLGGNQNLTITDSTFEKNSVNLDNSSGSSSGAAVSVMGQGSDSTLTITDSTFSYNTYDDGDSTPNGTYGGAIGVQNTTVTLSNITLDNNTASSSRQAQGGGYYQSVGTLTASNLQVLSNKIVSSPNAFGAGMALWGVDTTITHTKFDGNTIEGATDGLGGGLYLRGNYWGGDPDRKATISDTVFSGNTITAESGAYGGGAYIKGDEPGFNYTANFDNVIFDNNSVSGQKVSQGGALYILGEDEDDNLVPGAASVTITNGTITNNKAIGENGQGGAIYNAGTLTLKGDNLFSGNTAAEGKDIYNVGDLTFDGSNTSMEDMVLADGNLDVINNSLVYIGTLDARGGSIFVDPSGLIIGNLTDNKLGSNLVAGSGAITNIGNMDNDVLVNAITDAGMSVNPGMTTDKSNAVLALNNSITLGDAAQIVVDADAQKGPNDTIMVGGETVTQDAYFGDDSLLVVNAANLTDGTAIKAEPTGQTAFVASDAKLRIINAKAGEWVTVLEGFTIVDEEGNPGQWNPDKDVENLDYMLESIAIQDAGDIVVRTDVKDPTEALPGIDPDLAPMMLSVWEKALNDVDSPDMGVRFLSRAVRADYINGDAAKSAATIESAARIAFAGAVPQMTKMASDAATNAVVNRLGFANPADGAQAMNAEGQIVDRNTTGFALWIAPLWQSQHGWGMEAGNLDYGFNGNLGGVSLGADYTFENAIRAGITFNIGGGYAETSGGDLNSTENRMTFWGLGAYAGWNYENFGLMADVSYTSTWNQLEQDLDPGMGMGDLEADVQATAISAGLRAEYKLETSVLDIIPHVGVRYMSLNTWGYDVDANGGTVMEGDGFHQDIWTFPVGVTFSKDITLDSGWFFKPSVDFSVIPAAGDIKAREDVRFTGAPAVAEMETQMMDYLTWQGGVGVQLGNDNLSFGVNYTLQAGQNTTGHGVFGNFRYEF